MNEIHNEPRATPLDGALERLFELAATLGEVMERGLAERGLTRARATVLWQLHHTGPVTQRELSQALRVTPRNVTALLDALQAAGFLSREPHPADRRAVLVTLTGHGQAATDRLHAGYQQLAAALFAGIAADDVTRFASTLGHVLERLHNVDFNKIAETTAQRPGQPVSTPPPIP